MGGLLAVLIIMFTSAQTAFATGYIVGDKAEWSTGVDYEKWVSGKSFAVGDNLIFKYSSIHGVIQVNKDEYDNCVITHPIKSYSGGNNTILLDRTGNLYFLCPTSCYPHAQPMKLAVKVSAAASPIRANKATRGPEGRTGLLLGASHVVAILLPLVG